MRPVAQSDRPRHFWNQVDTSAGLFGCWSWLGSSGSAGYGLVKFHGRRTSGAHRIAWELTNGPIPAGLYVCHTCDNRVCVNPAHLWLGTNRDNQIDAKLKGRLAVGARNARAVFDETTVRSIRARVAAGESKAAIARDIGAKRVTVSAAATGRHYASERRKANARDLNRCIGPLVGMALPCEGGIELDHVRASGGLGMKSPSTADNLVSLCGRHHRIKTEFGRVWRPKLLAYVDNAAAR